jgi:hypothetical protein
MWYNMEGGIMEPVLRGCMQLVLEYVQQNPGITTTTLLRKLNIVFLPGEIVDVLSIMEQRKCIRSRPFVHPTKPSLFSTPQKFRTIGR